MNIKEMKWRKFRKMSKTFNKKYYLKLEFVKEGWGHPLDRIYIQEENILLETIETEEKGYIESLVKQMERDDNTWEKEFTGMERIKGRKVFDGRIVLSGIEDNLEGFRQEIEERDVIEDFIDIGESLRYLVKVSEKNNLVMVNEKKEGFEKREIFELNLDLHEENFDRFNEVRLKKVLMEQAFYSSSYDFKDTSFLEWFPNTHCLIIRDRKGCDVKYKLGIINNKGKVVIKNMGFWRFYGFGDLDILFRSGFNYNISGMVGIFYLKRDIYSWKKRAKYFGFSRKHKTFSLDSLEEVDLEDNLEEDFEEEDFEEEDFEFEN